MKGIIENIMKDGVANNETYGKHIISSLEGISSTLLDGKGYLLFYLLQYTK